MLNERFAGFDGGEEMLIKLTPPPAVGFLEMVRRMTSRETNKQTHLKTYTMTELVAGVDFDLIPSRIYEFVITTDQANAQIAIQISFDGKDAINGAFSQGTDAALADFRVTVKKAA